MSNENRFFGEVCTEKHSSYDEEMGVYLGQEGLILLGEVVFELRDPDYIRYRHYRRHTHYKGCRGPLCTKAIRDHMREFNLSRGRESKPTSYTQDVDEFLERYMQSSRTSSDPVEVS